MWQAAVNILGRLTERRQSSTKVKRTCCCCETCSLNNQRFLFVSAIFCCLYATIAQSAGMCKGQTFQDRDNELELWPTSAYFKNMPYYHMIAYSLVILNLLHKPWQHLQHHIAPRNAPLCHREHKKWDRWGKKTEASWATFLHSQCVSVDSTSKAHSVFPALASWLGPTTRTCFWQLATFTFEFRMHLCVWGPLSLLAWSCFFACRCWLTPCNTSCLALQRQRKVFLLLFEVGNLSPGAD